jgi:hypothetical protein
MKQKITLKEKRLRKHTNGKCNNMGTADDNR